MNKTITVYELLGLVKDGKVPKHIKYKDYDLVWEESLCYYRTNRYGGWEMFYFNLSNLNDTVEIIEDNDKLEKINVKTGDNCKRFIEYDDETGHHKYTIRLLDEYFAKNINKIRDHINKIEERLDEK